MERFGPFPFCTLESDSHAFPTTSRLILKLSLSVLLASPLSSGIGYFTHGCANPSWRPTTPPPARAWFITPIPFKCPARNSGPEVPTHTRLKVIAGKTTLVYEELNLNPEQIVRRSIDSPGTQPYSVQVTLESRAGDPRKALDLNPPSSVQIALLRRLGRSEEAIELRFAARLRDPAERTYPVVPDHEAEPKSVRPRIIPSCSITSPTSRRNSEQTGVADHARASAAFDYIFPSRASSQPVLEAAIRHNNSDATAHYLYGALLLHFRKTDEAISAWQKARQLKPGMLTPHRNLGRALLDLKNDPRAALVVLQEGLTHDPNNQDLRLAINRARLAAP